MPQLVCTLSFNTIIIIITLYCSHLNGFETEVNRGHIPCNPNPPGIPFLTLPPHSHFAPYCACWLLLILIPHTSLHPLTPVSFVCSPCTSFFPLERLSRSKGCVSLLLRCYAYYSFIIRYARVRLREKDSPNV